MRIKQLSCQPDLLQGHSTPITPKAESVPNFYQVQTLRRRNETRAISMSCLQPRDDFVDVHFVERDLCHRPNHEPDHFVKKTVPCNFDCDPRPASPNLSGPNRAHCVLFFFATPICVTPPPRSLTIM